MNKITAEKYNEIVVAIKCGARFYNDGYYWRLGCGRYVWRADYIDFCLGVWERVEVET